MVRLPDWFRDEDPNGICRRISPAYRPGELRSYLLFGLVKKLTIDGSVGDFYVSRIPETIGSIWDPFSAAGAFADLSSRKIGFRDRSSIYAKMRRDEDPVPRHILVADFGYVRGQYIVCDNPEAMLGVVSIRGAPAIAMTERDALIDIAATGCALAVQDTISENGPLAQGILNHANDADEAAFRRSLTDDYGHLAFDDDRYRIIMRFQVCVLRALGIYGSNGNDAAQRRVKSAAILQLESDDRLLAHFTLDLCEGFSKHLMDRLADDYLSLLKERCLPPLGGRVTLRITDGFGGANKNDGDLVVRLESGTPWSLGSFVHNYMRLYDRMNGRPSEGPRFADVLERYYALVSMDPAFRSSNERQRQRISYSEAYARCWEIYVTRRRGRCVIQRDIHGLRGYYEDERLDVLMDRYVRTV